MIAYSTCHGRQVITLFNALYSVINDQALYQISIDQPTVVSCAAKEWAIGDWFPCSDASWSLQINDKQGVSIKINHIVDGVTYCGDATIQFTGAIPVYQIQDGNITVTLEPVD
ncbi:hypothetical protein GGP41_008759 [Bipolaris sorokiniana]|uniref:Uncharacterized protein n=2 Tax=Cochliobolus sativus TaxID=45130 RepID=A0A8H5ZB63_COCSA|nr:uncharacterized protein COCSADRAFT_350472 [Bipolaris sorokiniana ND90Pr]EMD68760.1 hypothetical protein COCSADRAFT_350472 [Bipolaris sorokiniana ND90Pr]KAF5844768.1 hypothetical protein GGP41_008759 [Bipolaris sorokiniana]